MQTLSLMLNRQMRPIIGETQTPMLNDHLNLILGILPQGKRKIAQHQPRQVNLSLRTPTYVKEFKNNNGTINV